MHIEEIKRIIVNQREEIDEKLKKNNIIQRICNKEKLKRFLRVPNIVAILGVRRCGKSVFSWQVFEKEKFGYINFDDERLFGIKAIDLDKILQAFYELYGIIDYVILDEPQNIEGWELFVNRLRRTKKVIITGRNSKLLEGELATHLTGRYVDFNLFPFSFREFLDYHKFIFQANDFYSTRKVAQLKNSLENYLKIGGFPETYLIGREILVRIYLDIIEKDIFQRVKLRNKETFRKMAKYF